MKKIIALALSGLLLLALAACGTQEQEEPTSEPVTEAAVLTTEEETGTALEIEETTTEPGDSQTAGGEMTDLVTETVVPALFAPTDKAGILALYNAGLTKSGGLNRVAYSREAVTVTFTDIRLLRVKVSEDLDRLDELTREDLMGIDNRRRPHDLVSLTDAQVQSAKLLSVQGVNLATFELQLQNVSSASPVPQGYGGYFSLVTFETAMKLLTDYSSEEWPVSDNTTITTFNMTQGKLLVTIDLESGEIVSAEGSYMEEILGDGKVSGLTLLVTLKFNVKAAYKA